MNGREGSGLGIAEQDGNTIGSFYRQQNPRRSANQRVTVLFVAEHAGFGSRFLLALNNAHVGAVDLPAAGQSPVAVKQSEEATPVLVNIFRFVFVESGEV